MLLVVTSSDAVNYPAETFVFQAEDFTENARAWFSTVATTGDIQEYPVDAPAAPVNGLQQPYFRKDQLILVSRSPYDLERLIAEIEGRLLILERNLSALYSLQTP